MAENPYVGLTMIPLRTEATSKIDGAVGELDILHKGVGFVSAYTQHTVSFGFYIPAEHRCITYKLRGAQLEPFEMSFGTGLPNDDRLYLMALRDKIDEVLKHG